MAAAANIQALSVIAALVLSAQAVPQTTKIVHEKHVAHARAARRDFFPHKTHLVTLQLCARRACVHTGRRVDSVPCSRGA